MKGGIRTRSQGVNCPPPLRQTIRAAGFPVRWFLPARGLFRNLEAPGALVIHGLKVATQREMEVETVLQSLTTQPDQAPPGIHRTPLRLKNLKNA